MKILDIDDIDDTEIDSDDDSIPPLDEVVSLEITGFCGSCGNPIKGKPRKFCDIVCLRDFKMLSKDYYE